MNLHDDRACELGEGAFWHPGRGALFWFDILGRRLLSREGETPLEWPMGECASAAGWIDRDRLLIATETGLHRVDLRDGSRARVVAVEAEDPGTRSNDGRADPWGGFWFGTMGKAAEPGRGAIYRFHGGRVTKLVASVTIPNAICFDKARALAYWADTATGRVMAQPLDRAGWPEGEARLFLDLGAQGLNPDGAVTDAEGAIWNAQWGAGRVARYLPDGSLERIHPVPGLHASCPAFGGPDLTHLYVTTAREGLADPDPAQGRTYVIATGIAGLPEPRVVL